MTLAVLKTFIETDLVDSALQVIFDSADEDITTVVGPDTTMVEEREMDGQRILWLERPLDTLVGGSITETDSSGNMTTLATDDYHVHPNQMRIMRLNTGTNPKGGWTGLVTLTYTPGDLNQRNRAIQALVQLELDFRHGKKSESIGDHSMTQQDYNTARARIISQAQSRSMA